MIGFSFMERVGFELDEIALCQGECATATALMRQMLGARKFDDALEYARQATVKARDLHTMLAHIEALVAVEIQPSEDDFEDSKLVYEGKVA